ncbi:MAG TPA: MFS transporter [Paenibacillus sp.]
MVDQVMPQGSKGLLHNRAYMSLMASQLISNLGDWLHLLALLMMVGLKWHATPWQITTIMLCSMLPMLVGGPLAGMLADRMERKKLMILADVVRIFIVLGLVFVTDIWQVYVLIVAKSIFDVMFSPAKNGKIKEVVPKEHLEKAVSYSAIIEQGSKIVGPALGGVLTAAFGVSICFMIDSASFLLSALLLLFVPGKIVVAHTEAGEISSAKPAKSGLLHELGAGIREIIGIPLVAYSTLMLAMTLLVLQIADSQAIVLFRDIPNLPEDLLGWCIAASGGGTLLAAGLNGFISKYSFSPLLKMGVGGMLLGLVFAFTGGLAIFGTFNQIGIIVILILFVLAGLGAGMTFIPFQVMLQQRTPEALIGRVFGTVTSVTSTAALIGPVVGGYLVTTFGPQIAFIISGSLVALIGCVLLMFKSTILKRDGMVQSTKVPARNDLVLGEMK